MTEKKYFYSKNKSREIVPVSDDHLQNQDKLLLEDIYQKRNELHIPKYYIENWSDVKLYNPAGNIEKADALILNVQDGAYDLKNKMNNLTGKEWTKFTCSWFIFNALASDLKEERAVTLDTQDHPATYSPTMVSDFIKFFT